MKTEDLQKLIATPAMRKRNPHLISKGDTVGAELCRIATKSGDFGLEKVAVVQIDPKPSRQRIKQPAKGPNKLELDAAAWLRSIGWEGVRHQALKIELAAGCWYTPDLIWMGSTYKDKPRAWEVKGDWMLDDSVVKLKVAARSWPGIKFTLLWRDKGTGSWQEQEVKP